MQTAASLLLACPASSVSFIGHTGERQQSIGGAEAMAKLRGDQY
jgi:hypothetical protein